MNWRKQSMEWPTKIFITMTCGIGVAEKCEGEKTGQRTDFQHAELTEREKEILLLICQELQ